MSWLSRQWQRLNDATIGTDAYWSIAVQNESIFSDTRPLIADFVRGKTLDIGAGSLAWRKTLSAQASSYLSSDFAVTHKDIDCVFDVTKPFPLADNSLDSLFCHSVLEHTKKPWEAFGELHRILKNEGTLVLSVPFLFYLHGAPHDYFRFTKFGIVMLATDAGFSVDKVTLNGGIFSFILNLPSVVVSTILFDIGCRAFIPVATGLLAWCAKILDSLFDPQRLFALNIVLVLRKKPRR
jgi:SAM-dependent methyltransferase